MITLPLIAYVYMDFLKFFLQMCQEMANFNVSTTLAMSNYIYPVILTLPGGRCHSLGVAWHKDIRNRLKKMDKAYSFT